MRINSLSLVLDIRVLSNLILIARLGILTRLIHRSRSQVLKGNTLVYRTSLNTLVNSDLDINITLRGLRSELHRLLRLTNNRLISLVTQLSIQNVFLIRNQTLIVNMVSNNRASLQSLMLTKLINRRTNRRLQLRGVGATSTIVRQSRLINWDYSLTKTFTNFPITVRTDNGNKGVSRLTLNSHRWVSFKHCINIAILTSVTYDPETRERSELVLTARKSLEAGGVGNTAPPNHLNSLCTTSTVRD